MRLTVELVPQTSWGHNVRTIVPGKTWDLIRRRCYQDAEYKCDICGGTGVRHPVECHEIWDYDDESCIQKLVGFLALCPLCHRVKHLGRTYSVGLGRSAVQQLCKVNFMTVEQVGEYIDSVFIQWHKRSEFDWTVDLEYIETYLE